MTIKISESELRKLVTSVVRNVLKEFVDNQSILVEHIIGSAKYEPKDGGTWKDYWEKKSNRPFPSKRTKCACCGEMKEPEEFVGGHIMEVANHRMKYIHPICETCNDTYGEGKIESKQFLVKRADCVKWLKSESKIVRHEE